jgi:D-alanyl-D-alanine carboxypeptidase
VFKPILRVLTIAPLLSIAAAAALFPVVSAPAAAETPSPTATAVPTPTRQPPAYEFNPNLYSLDDSSSPWVVVNKHTPMYPINYKPKKLVKPAFAGAGVNPYGMQMAKVAAAAMVKMAKAMKGAGAGTLILQSGYRSYATQVSVHKKAVAKYGKTKGEDLAARPGYSEHQTGLSADLAAVGQGCVIRVCFAKTKAGKWLAQNAYKYGFILRYPDGQTPITGYQFEPWHFRYVGVELATQMALTRVPVLEVFWNLPYAPNYL